VTLRLANIYGPRQRKDLEGGGVAIFPFGCWDSIGIQSRIWPPGVRVVATTLSRAARRWK